MISPERNSNAFDTFLNQNENQNMSVPQFSLSPDQVDFLTRHHLEKAPVSFLAGDASFRKYYRIGIPPHSLVLMDAPSPENPTLFVQIAKLLRSHGFSAPGILADDFDKGLVLLEDLGDQTYTRVLQQNSDDLTTRDLYFLAIDVLIDLHKKMTDQPDFINSYLPEIHLKEANLLLSWYYPAIYKNSLSKNAQLEYENLWLTLLHQSYGPNSLILRDYHVDNLLLLKDRQGTQKCGILDFQDALWGSVTYDIVSLLEDARRDVSKEIQTQCWDRYCAAFPTLDPYLLQEQGAILSAARHAKIIGIFTRLAIRDHKPGYLKHIPRLWSLLNHCLEHPTLTDLKGWFDRHFPERSIPHV